MWKLSEDNIHYTDGELMYPRCTHIIGSVGLSDFSMVDPEVLERACQYGSVVHYATELFDKNKLDITSLDETVMLDVMAWDNFKKDNDVEILEIEKTYVSHRYRYGCTIDRVAMFQGVLSIIDIKTATLFHRSAALQLAANKKAYNENITDRSLMAKKRVLVRLDQEGGYRLPNKEIFTTNDFSVFEGAKRVYDYKNAA